MTRERGSRAESKNCEILLLPTADRRFDTKFKCPTGRASFWVKCPGIARGGDGRFWNWLVHYLWLIFHRNRARFSRKRTVSSSITILSLATIWTTAMYIYFFHFEVRVASGDCGVVMRGALGFSVLRIWPIFDSVFRFLCQKTSVFRFWCFVRFASFLRCGLWFSVFVNNDGGFSDFSA